MTRAEGERLPLGLYFFEWHSGGGSVAAVGMCSNGNRWVAPTNWTFPSSWTAEDWESVKSARLITTQQEQVAKMKAEPKTPVIRTCTELMEWFCKYQYSGLWKVYVESGVCFLKYTGPNPEGMEPNEPIVLELDSCASSLIAELMNMVGIPAQRA